MQIKFNKLVKPVVPLSESEISQPAADPGLVEKRTVRFVP